MKKQSEKEVFIYRRNISSFLYRPSPYMQAKNAFYFSILMVLFFHFFSHFFFIICFVLFTVIYRLLWLCSKQRTHNFFGSKKKKPDCKRSKKEIISYEKQKQKPINNVNICIFQIAINFCQTE